MQDLVTDRLAAKRIPASSTSVRAPAAGIELDRTYTGPMAISGTLSADNGQNGNWSGTLKATLHVSVDASGNGTGYESFSGNITLHVGDRSSTEPLTFETPVFSLQGGKFDYPSGSFTYGNLIFSLDVKGSFKGTQQTISEHLSLPFTGFVNGIAVSGSLNGNSIVKTLPLTIGGSYSPQSSYSASTVRPFQDTVVSDLSGTTVTATVTLSAAANGTLTNLAGGTYNPKTGIYTITGNGGTVARAIKGLTFVSAGDLGSSGRPGQTGFTLRVTDGAGAVRSIRTHVTTAEPLSVTGIVARQSTNGTTTIDPFNTVRINEVRGHHLETLKIELSNPSNGAFENLSGGTYIKKTGVYLFKGTAAKATVALHKLEFVPTQSGVATKFTITAENSNGAFITANTVVIAKRTAMSANAMAGAALFSQYVSLGFDGAHDQGWLLSSRHDLPAHPLSDLAGSHR